MKTEDHQCSRVKRIARPLPLYSPNKCYYRLTLDSDILFMNFLLVQEILGLEGMNLANFSLARNDENYLFKVKNLLKEEGNRKLP